LECRPENRAAPALVIEPTGRRFAPPCPSPPRDSRETRAIEQAYGLGVQVTHLIGLQLVGQDAKRQMAGQGRGGCLLIPGSAIPTRSARAARGCDEVRSLKSVIRQLHAE
jgi:hypothetical protein